MLTSLEVLKYYPLFKVLLSSSERNEKYNGKLWNWYQKI